MKTKNFIKIIALCLIVIAVSCKKDENNDDNNNNNNNNNNTSFTCGNNLTDSRDNKSYPTISIGGKCWFKKNMDIGTKINLTANPSNNSTIEKYCYDNSDANCTTYGGLYNWDEMMQYVSTEGAAGICPTGWHIPTDAEWTALINLYPAGTAGTALMVGGSSGFEAKLGGRRGADGGAWQITEGGYFWSSSLNGSNPKYRFFYNGSTDVTNNSSPTNYGFSVRCIKN